MKKIYISILTLLILSIFSGCDQRDAKIASYNLSYEADNFQLHRRIVFYNGITDKYVLTIDGYCNIETNGRKLAVTCKVGQDKYKKHYLGLSDNVTYFVEQLDSKNVSVYHYKVQFKPQVIVPDVDFKGSSKALNKAIIPDNKD
jgi:hypothetical protein